MKEPPDFFCKQLTRRCIALSMQVKINPEGFILQVKAHRKVTAKVMLSFGFTDQ